MSSGGNKKKVTRSQGWEEAGNEFYQECFPIDSDIDVLQRDPKHLTTLLPSKQTRAGKFSMSILSRVNLFCYQKNMVYQKYTE